MSDPTTLESIFFAALEKAPGQRADYLNEACAGDDDLRRRVERMLAAQVDGRSFLETPPSAVAASVNPLMTGAALEKPGTQIGSYKLLRQIGEGGMGTVFMAEQMYPVRRKVALKVIKPGMDSRQVISRFESERQALALMDHVNIARVLDAGATESGRPYFVMELVQGVPITRYCDDNRLTPRKRLELFVPVCQAIQHAHQKGIIHRDIKPSNVMITLYDGKPVPKVIDFGVAKAIHGAPGLTEQTLFTQYGTMVGTLEYMSPEQAGSSALGVDTRSDVFSLGVLLYELLTGSTPLDSKQMQEAAQVEVLRMIREDDPPRPSIRLGDSGEALASISAQRHTEPAKLTKLVRGELDWIVMKALEKDRSRRYETANGFAMDVQRYLNDEAVEANPPSAGYRWRKFARRHKTAFRAAVAFGALLILGVVVSTWQAVRATVAEGQANVDRIRAVTAGEQANASEAIARIEAQKAKDSESDARAVLKFFEEKVLAAARPENQDGGLGIDATIRAAVDAAEPQIGPAFQDRPVVEASIRNSLGESYRYLGEPALAIRQHERSQQLRSDQLGPDHPDTLSSMADLALAYKDAGKLDLALPLYEQTLEKRKATLGPNHSDTLTSMNNLAMAYKATGKLDLALPLFEETLEKRKATLGPDHQDTLLSMNNLANGYRAVGKLDQALTLFQKALAARNEKLGADHPDTLTSMGDLARTYGDAGKFDQALPLLEETLEKMKAKIGPDHPTTLTTMNNLAATYHEAGKLDQALPLYEQTLEKQKAKLGPDHPVTLGIMSNLANAYQAVGKLDQALPLFEETMEKVKAKLGPDHPNTLITSNGLARAYMAAGKFDRALPILDETLDKQKATLGPDHSDTLYSMNNLATLYRELKRLDDAEPLFRDAVTGARRTLGMDHSLTQTCLRNLADCHDQLHQPEKAEPLWRELAAFWKEKAGADSLQYAAELHCLGASLVAQDRPADAEPLLRDCLAIRESSQPDAWTTFCTKSVLGACLLGRKLFAEAEPLLLAAHEGLEKIKVRTPQRDADRRLRESLERLVQLYEAMGDQYKAAEWRKKLDDQ